MELIADENGALFQERYNEEENEFIFGNLAPQIPKNLKKQFVDLHESPRKDLRHRRTTKVNNVVSKSSFVVSPDTVVFSDFEIGNTYSVELIVTNCTSRLSTFRVLPLSSEYKGVFSVHYEIPLRISPGLQWPVTLVFCPTTAEAICGELILKVDDGSLVKVPIKAEPPQASLRLSTETVDFGTVTIGESIKRKLVFVNDGSLNIEVAIYGSFKKILKEVHFDPRTAEEKPFLKLSQNNLKFNVLPLSAKFIEFIFSPLQECSLHCELIVEDGQTIRRVVIKGSATAQSIFAVNNEINFHCCFYGSEYFDTVEIINNSSLPTTVTPKISSTLRDVIRFEPDYLIIQSASSLFLKVFFTPSENLGSTVDTVIELHAKGQNISTYVRILASLSQRGFSVTPLVLDLGSIFINEERCCHFNATNFLDLPQKIEFSQLPSNVITFPQKTTLMPNESFRFELLFNPTKVGNFSIPLRVIGEHGDENFLKLSGCVLCPFLFFSESTLRFSPCPVGGCISASTVLTSSSDECRDFHFVVPSECIRISPSAGTIDPHGSIVVMFFFEPGQDAFRRAEAPPLNSLSNLNPTSTYTRDFTTASLNTSLKDDSFPPCCRWEKEPSYNRAFRQAMKIGCCSSGSVSETVYVTLDCIMIAPEVVVSQLSDSDLVSLGISAEPPPQPGVLSVSAPPLDAAQHQESLPSTGACCAHVDFGPAAIGQSVLKSCFIKNTSDIPVFLRLHPFAPTSHFGVARPPPASLGPGEEDILLFCFKPAEYGIFYEKARLFCDSNNVSVFLKGSCAATDLIMTTDSALPNASSREGAAVDSVFFAPTLVQDTSQTTVFFHNIGTFPLDVFLRFDDSGDTRRTLRVQDSPFLFEPCEFRVPAEGKMAVTVLFHPRHEGMYASTAHITAGKLSRVLTLNGLSTRSRVYIRCPSENSVDFMNGRRVSPLKFDSEGRSVDFPFALSFGDGETKSFILGTVHGGPAADCVVELLEECFPADDWEASTQKVAIPSGSEVTLSFTLKRSKPEDERIVRSSKYAISIKCQADSTNNCKFYCLFTERK